MSISWSAGYAVGIHGYVRPPAISTSGSGQVRPTLPRLFRHYVSSDLNRSDLSDNLFLKKGNLVRMGVPPLRLELLTSISGVEFEECYRERIIVSIDDVPVSVISLDRLLQNKRAAGRVKDLLDLENLPGPGE